MKKKLTTSIAMGAFLICLSGTAAQANRIDWADEGLSNWALDGTATQSSVVQARYADLAIDGNTSGNWFDGSVTATNREYQAWWQVTFSEEQDIEGIDIWNRTDADGNRLSNFDVSIFDADDNQVWSQYVGSVGTSWDVDFETAHTGQTIRVQLRGTNYLSLAEVGVWGNTSMGDEFEEPETGEIVGDDGTPIIVDGGGNPDPNAPVPEPATMLLFGTGLVGLAGARRRKMKKESL